MGRGAAAERVPVEVVLETFRVRQDGALIRIKCRIGARVDEPATHRGPGGRLLVRVYVDDKVRRFAAGRIAWVVHCGEWPQGVVKCRNADDDFRRENLIAAKAGPRPFDQAKGRKAASLTERQASNARLLEALAEHPGSTVPVLSKLVGASAPCTCTRLGKLADTGFCVGPKCDARARWDLTAQGKELAMNGQTLILDERDRDILIAVARSPTKIVSIACAIGACRLTAKRRVDLLVKRGLAVEGDGKFTATEAGLAALGPMPQRWLDMTRVSAAWAKDVQRRQHGPRADEVEAEALEPANAASLKRVDKWTRLALAS